MDSDSNHSDNVLSTDTDFHTRVKFRPATELPQTSSTEGTKSNLQESFSTQVLEFYKNSAGQEVVSQGLQSMLIPPEATGSLDVDHGAGQQAAGQGLDPQLDLNDVGLGLGLDLSSDAIAVPRQHIPKHVSSLSEPGSRHRPRPICSDNLDVEINPPRERKKWVKPPLFEHTSGSDERDHEPFDGHLFSEQNSIDYQRNFAGRHIGQRTGDKHHSKTFDLGTAHHTQIVDNSLEISSNEGLPNISIMEDGAMIEHDGSNESQPKSALDISLDASGHRASSPSSSIASNKRGLEWDSGADVGYHYQAKASAQVHQISTFERIALARGSRAYHLTSDVKTCVSSNSQPPAIQTTESFKKSEHSQMTDTQKGREISKNYKYGDTNKLRLYQRTEGKVQTFPPKYVSDVKAYAPLHNTLSGLELYKLVSGGVSSKVTPPPPLFREGISTETSDEEVTLKQDSHREHKSLQGPLAQSTPLDLKENRTKARFYTKRTHKEAEQNDNQESSYFSKKSSPSTTEISFIPQESERVGKACDRDESSNRKEQSYGKENATTTGLLVGDNLQTLDKLTSQKASDIYINSPKLLTTVTGDETPHTHNTEKPNHVFCVEEIEELIQNIQRKANKHQVHIDKFVKQAHSQQIIPSTFPRTRREESLSRNSSSREWAQSRDQEDPINNPIQQTCSMESTGGHKKSSNRSESTNSVSPCISPQLDEEGSCSSVSSCYFSDTPQSGNVANERGTVGSTGSFEYLPGHVYEKTNIKNLNAQSKVQVQGRSGSDSQRRKPNSLEEDLKVWAQLCQDDVIKTKDVVNQIVHTNYLEDEEDEGTSEIPLQTGCSGSESGQSEKPFNTAELSAVNLTPKYCDKGTQIETIFNTASSDVESNTSSRRPGTYKKEETSDKTCDATEDSSRPSSCTHGIAKGSSSSTFSSAGYNTSTSRSFSNCEAGDWRKPATQSEQEFERRDMSNKKHKSKHAGTQHERLAIIDKKINHLNNLKMILERQEKLKNSLKIDNAKIDSVPLPVPNHHSVYTVMTATVSQSEENDENETSVNELHLPSERTIPSESLLEGQSDSVVNWSSHHHLISRNTREISTQVPSSVSLKVLKEHNTNATSLKHRPTKEDLGENKLTEGKKEICTQTPSDFSVAKPLDTDSIDCRTNRGRVNVHVQTVQEESENKNKKQVKINRPTTEQLCCCQCEENLLIIKEKTNSIGVNANTKLSYSTSTESCPVSCNCKCHNKHKSISPPKSGHNLNYVPISVSKSPEPHKNIVPIHVTCNCKKLCTSTPVASSSTCNGSTCYHHHNEVLKNTTLQAHYQTPITPISDSLATPTSPNANPRNATRSIATSTVDNKGVQTSDSVGQLPIIRPLWFSTANSHVKIRGKKCVCCSHQPVKKNQDSKIIFEETSLLQKSSKHKSSSCSENVICPQKSSYKSSSRSEDVRCPHKPNSSTYKSSSSHHEDVRCPHQSSTYKSDSRSEDVRCPHISSTCKSSSSHVEDVISRCKKCRRDIQVCHCKSVKTSTTTGTSEDSWDISALGARTGSKSENIETPRSIGYLLTFETVSGDKSSSSETVRKRSLQEVKVKIPAPKPTSVHKNHRRTRHGKEKTKWKTDDILPQKNSFQEVRAQIPSRKSHVHREEKPTEILNSNQLADNLGENNSKSDSLEETAMKSSPERKNRRDQSHSSRLTLQDYLRQARPDYIRIAEARRRCLAELADLRVLRHENRQRLLALASQPGSTIDTETLSSANSMLPPPPMAIKRVFNQRVMRKQTEKGYQKCPEVVNKKVDRKRKEDYRTNRLMAEIFTKKLQRKALRGDVNLSNSVSVISIL